MEDKESDELLQAFLKIVFLAEISVVSSPMHLENNIHCFPARRLAREESKEKKPSSLLVKLLTMTLNGIFPSLRAKLGGEAKRSTCRCGSLCFRASKQSMISYA